MFKKLIVVALSLFTFACALTPTSEISTESKERVYQQTANYVQLVKLYKTQLASNGDMMTRVKLAETYLALKDPDNALFYITPAVLSEPFSCRAYLIQAKSLHLQGELEQAEQAVLIGLAQCPKSADMENLLGIVYASQYKYQQARDSFDAARIHYYDGDIISNNLAVLDIAEGDYRSAIHRLLPIYRNGKADDKIMANLVLSMAKEGQYQFVHQVLEANHTKSEITQIYKVLRQYEPLTRIGNDSFKATNNA